MEKQNINEGEDDDILEDYNWLDIVNLPPNKKIKNDYPSVSQKSYKIIDVMLIYLHIQVFISYFQK